MQSNGRAAAAIWAILVAADVLAVRRAWAPGSDRLLVLLAIACTLGAAIATGWLYQSLAARIARPRLRALVAGFPFALLVGVPLGRAQLVKPILGAAALPLAILASALTAGAIARVVSIRPTRALGICAVAAASGLLLAADGVRQPILHGAAVAASVALLMFALASGRDPASRRSLTLTAAVAALLTLAAWQTLQASANVNFVARTQAPLTALALRSAAMVKPIRAATAAPQPGPAYGARAQGSSGRTPYGDANLVLITVDAQRADAPLPRLDARIGAAVRFTRVYAQAPHTAWSITSLLAGAPPDRLRPPGGPSTLADRLRARHFYTDAFYPAGLFFDGRAPLERYAASRFGFEWTDTRTLDAPALTDAILARLAEDRHQWTDEPRLFLWAHYFDPHEPYVAHDPAATAPRARYASEVALVDQQLVRLIDALAALPRPTLVAVTADHGEEFGEHGGAYHGTSVYEEQVRVPLRLFVVGGTPLDPRTLDTPVELVDLAPTLLDLLGLEAEGHSLVPLLDDEPTLPRDAHAQVDTRRMLVRDRWKLIVDQRGDVRELYDLEVDPGEHRNVIGAEPQRAAALGAALADWFNLSAPGSLVATLADPQATAERRVAAARALGLGQPPSAAAALRASLSADDPSVRAEAALALAELSDDAARAPLAALLDDPRLRRRAALGLGHLRDPRALPALREALSDIDATIRRHAVHYLGWLGSAGDAPLLESRAVDDLKIRAEAYQALGRLAGRTGAPGVITFLEHRLTVEEYDDARARLTEALRPTAPVTREPN
jgi:arylsulfatase A-like enzyme